MTGHPLEEREQFAAEHALGVLDADERARAEAMIAEDAAFADQVAAWLDRLAPLLDDIAPVEPGPAPWQRINAALDAGGERATNVFGIERALRRWKGATAALAAVAAALALALVLPVTRQSLPIDRQAPVTASPITASPMTASIAAEGASPSFMLAYTPADRSLTVMPAAVSPVAGHSHELWLIPDGGKPMALGVIDAAKPMRMTMPADMAAHMIGSAMLAVSAEPAGGSPTGQPTGPVIGSGHLQSV